MRAPEPADQTKNAPENTTQTILFGPPRTIYVISPQPWDGFRVSKHHYAIELAGLGHRVFFIDPPDVTRPRGEIRISQTEHQGLSSVRYGPWFPYTTKFHARWLFDKGMAKQARMLIAAIGAPPDIVWDFDNTYQFTDLRVFGAPLKIYHLVDDFTPRRPADKNADIVFAVDQKFLDKLPENVAKDIVAHGLSREHEHYARKILDGGAQRILPQGRVTIGYVGNLAHGGIDWPAILAAIDANPGADYAFIGPYRKDAPTILQLKQRKNCTLHGFQSAEQILQRAPEIDVWLLCYDPRRTIDGATNSHKILEYLATGKTVLSNRIAAHAGNNLIEMPRLSNAEIPAMLGEILANLSERNAPERQTARAALALQHCYREHVAYIDRVLSQHTRHGVQPADAVAMTTGTRLTK